MKPRHRVSRAAIELIKRFEGYRRKAAQTPDGGWTIGYGHALTAREGAMVSEAEAEALLVYDLIEVSHVVNERVFAPLNQNEFDALVSFAFNIGTAAFESSEVLKRLNAGDRLQAACAMDLWRRADIDGERLGIDALVRRRATEKALFLTPQDAWPAAPTPVLRPQLDEDRAGAVPLTRPVAVQAPMEGGLVLVKAEEPSPQEPTAAEADPFVAAEPIPEPQQEPPPPPSVPLRAPPGPLSVGAIVPLAALAVLGAALFAGGLFWAFRFAPLAGVNPTGVMSVGWVAGVAGVIFFGLAAYRLFDRLARAYEDDALAG